MNRLSFAFACLAYSATARADDINSIVTMDTNCHVGLCLCVCVLAVDFSFVLRSFSLFYTFYSLTLLFFTFTFLVSLLFLLLLFYIPRRDFMCLHGKSFSFLLLEHVNMNVGIP